MKKNLLLLLAGLLPILGYSQEMLSLQAAIEIGLKNNYQIQIAERELDIARTNDDWSIAGRYPLVNGTLNINNNYNSNNNPASFFPQIQSLSSSVVPGAEVSWLLYNGSQVRLTKQQLEELARQGQGNVQIVIENTIQRIILAYYQALVQEEQLQVRDEVLNLSRDRLNYTKVRQEFGQAASFDVLQSQDAYLNDSTSWLIQQNTYDNALRDLNLAMGEDVLSRRYTLTDRLEFVVQNYALEDLQKQMLDNNRMLQNMIIGREIARIGTRLEETRMRPTVNMRLAVSDNIGYNVFANAISVAGDERNFGGIRTNAFNIFAGFTVSYPLLDWGIRRRGIQTAKLREITAQLGIEDQKRNLNTQLENTFATYNNQKQLVEVTNQLVQNAQRSLTIAGDRFESGLINVFDYRVVQLSYINATQARLNAIFNLKNTETELIRLVGGLVR